MKKTLSVLLLLSLMFLSFTACSNTGAPTNTPGDTTDGDSGPVPAFVDPIKDYDTVDETSIDGFTVKAKKYDYKENNVVLMNVENHSENNYTVTVDMTYYDDGGNEITKESQSYEGFSANWQKYFAFDPGIPFSSYDFTVTTEEYSGECYAQYVDISFGQLEEALTEVEGDTVTKYPSIISTCYPKNSSGYQLMTGYHLVVIDNTGKIFFSGSRGKKLIAPYAKGDNYSNILILQCLEGDLVWPEEIKDGVLGICAVESVTPYE